MRKPIAVFALCVGLCLLGCKARKAESKLQQAKALTSQNPVAALEQLDRALAEGGNPAEVAKAKAAAQQRLGQLAEAEQLLRSVLRETPQDHEALQQLANVCIAQNKLDEARLHLTAAIRHTPPHVPTLLLFATLASSEADGTAGLAALSLLDTDSYRAFRRSAEYVAARASLLAAQKDDRTVVLAWLSQHERSLSFDPRLSLLMAETLAKLEKGPLALWLLTRASSSPSAGSDVHEALAERALAVGNVQLAQKALAKMGGDLNRTPNVLLLEARLLELQDMGLEATKLTRRALDLVPAEREQQKTAYALTHARSLAKEGLFDAAREVLTGILHKEPGHARTLLLLAAIEIQAGHGEKASPLLGALLSDPRYSAQAQTLIVRAHLASKEPALAKNAARKFFDQDPSALHGRLLLAQTLAEVGDRAAALALLAAAPASLATRVELVRMRVALAEGIVSPAQMEEMISTYLRRGLDLPELKQALGRSLIVQKRLADAEKVFRDLARDDPGALEEVARLERELGRPQDAIATLERLVEVSPSSHSAWLVLALMRKEVGNTAGAAAAYEQALHLSPNDPVALNNLALLLLEPKANVVRAVSLARRAMAALPNNPALEDTLGWALLESESPQDLGEAVSLLERSSRALGTPEAAFHYGLALARAQRPKEAKRKLTQALQAPATPPGAPQPWRPRAEQALETLP